MRDSHSKWFQHLLLGCLALFTSSAQLSAQLQLEREFIGAAAAVSTVVSNGNEQQLQVDASFGESMIGYQEGDIIITVGFHQTATRSGERGIGHVVEEDDDEVASRVAVNAYPNPTVERLTVDLGDYREKFTQLRIIDVLGRTMKSHVVSGEELITFRQLDKLPNANYYLQGVSSDGELFQLATVMIVTY